MKVRHLIMYDTEWQALRVQLVRENSVRGGWLTPEGTNKNIELLRHYLNTAETKSERHLRLWRILNALNAIRMGYSGLNKFHGTCSSLVAKYREEISAEYKEIKYPLSLPQGQETYRAKIVANMSLFPETTLLSILRNLQNRRRSHAATARPELDWFLDVIESHLSRVSEPEMAG